jgi:phosphatidate cytidylyltransferase
MTLSRFISSTILMAVSVLAMVNDYLFIITICMLTVGGLYEFFYLIKKKDIPIYSYTGILIGLLIPLSIYTRFELTKNWELLFIVVGFLLIMMLQFRRADTQNAIVGLSTTLFGVLYVSWFFSFLVKIRLLLPGWDGIKLLAFIVIVTKAGDIGALLVGSQFGKHPLLRTVSPNKSVEGAFGSFAFSIAAAIAAKSFLPEVSHFSVLHVALMGAFFGGLGQLGDLSESLIKRDCQVKDSGKLMPGMGGVLDIIDSLLFSAPAFYLYMSSTLDLIRP